MVHEKSSEPFKMFVTGMHTIPYDISYGCSHFYRVCQLVCVVKFLLDQINCEEKFILLKQCIVFGFVAFFAHTLFFLKQSAAFEIILPSRASWSFL